MLNYHFGPRLKKLRESRRMNQITLASVICVSPTTISLYETGASQPQLDILIKLADFFCVTTDYLLGLEQERDIALTGSIKYDKQILLDFSSFYITHFRK